MKRREAIEGGENSSSKSPFIADRPLYKGEHRMPEPHIEIQEKIKAIMQSGGIGVLIGQRRIGKTTLLYDSIDSLDPLKRTNMIFVPCIFFEREKPWTQEDFLGTMAGFIQSSLKLKKDKGPDCSVPLSGGIEVSKFKRFIQGACGFCGDKKIVLILDDADVFGECLPFSSQKMFPEMARILDTFTNITYENKQPPQGKGISIIFSTGEGIDTSWVDYLKKVAPKTEILRLPLFNKKQTKELAHPKDVPLKYHPEAIDYLFTMTGGHPAFIQLICARVIHRKEKGNRANLDVTKKDVSQAIAAVLKDRDLKQFFQYWYKYSIPKAGRLVLERLVNEGAIDLDTGKVNGTRLKLEDAGVLGRLKEIQILEEKGDDVFLRIGLGKLLV